MDKVEEYVSSSQSYLNEADGMLKKQDYSKAGEMLWGAVAALIKRLEIMRGKPVKSGHYELIKAAKEIAELMQDEKLRKTIVKDASALHANYYEDFIDIDEFPEYWNTVTEAYSKLMEFLFANYTTGGYDDCC